MNTTEAKSSKKVRIAIVMILVALSSATQGCGILRGLMGGMRSGAPLGAARPAAGAAAVAAAPLKNNVNWATSAMKDVGNFVGKSVASAATAKGWGATLGGIGGAAVGSFIPGGAGLGRVFGTQLGNWISPK